MHVAVLLLLVESAIFVYMMPVYVAYYCTAYRGLT